MNSLRETVFKIYISFFLDLWHAYRSIWTIVASGRKRTTGERGLNIPVARVLKMNFVIGKIPFYKENPVQN